jgi:hypothetical protein
MLDFVVGSMFFALRVCVFAGVGGCDCRKGIREREQKLDPDYNEIEQNEVINGHALRKN